MGGISYKELLFSSFYRVYHPADRVADRKLTIVTMCAVTMCPLLILKFVII